MKLTKTLLFCCIGIAFILIESCSVSSPTRRYDYTYMYDNEQKLIHPDFKLFHESEETTKLYYHLNSTNLLYGRIAGDSALKANILVKYKVFASNKRKVILDSATYPLINFGVNNAEKVLQGHLKMNVPVGKTYPLEVRFRDVNKDFNVVYNLTIDKRLDNNEQFYLIRDDSRIIIKPVVSTNNQVEIEKSSLINSSDFILDFSSQEYTMTPPPFAENAPKYFQIPVDSSINLSFVDNRLKISQFSQINRLRPAGTNTTNALYFYHYYDGFPEIVGVDQLTLPIRYISTSTEYKKVINAVNYKKAIDAFWLNLAKDEERAKKMIREYYSRVELSNKYFSSYREGWKTDRGIIFIVYGIPSTVYLNQGRETWIYGEENNILSVKFEFVKQENPQSNNDYELIRSSDFKNNWYRAVDMWRQAKIY